MSIGLPISFCAMHCAGSVVQMMCVLVTTTQTQTGIYAMLATQDEFI